MLTLLPFVAFFGIFLVLLNTRPAPDWRRLFLRAALIWGTYLVLGTELVSLVQGVTPTGLASLWLVPIVAATFWLVRHFQKGGQLVLPGWRFPQAWSERVLWLVIIVVCAVTALIAWVAPPNTFDSLAYHLPKVAHWAQDRRVHFYTSGIYAQNNMTPGAEMIVLQLYVLGQGDRLANFVEWLAMLGSLIGTGLLAAQLGAKPTGQYMAAAFAVTLPMGIAQASSTMTDYVVTFWVICAACEVLAAFTEPLNWQAPVFASLAAGLGVLTKPTAVAYLFPLGLLFCIKMVKGWGIKQALGWGLIAIILATSVNFGHSMRTYTTYGNLISDPDHVAIHANTMLTPQGIFSNLLRNAALHTGTPFGKITEVVWVSVLKIHVKMGVDVNDPRTTSIGPYRKITFNRGENITGNPVHATLILLSFPLWFILRRRLGVLPLIYALVVASTFFLFSAVFKWQIFSSRYHLPFFVLYAPLVGVLLSRFLPAWAMSLAGIALLALAWPWLTGLPERPLLTDDAQSDYPSILLQSRAELYYSPSVRYAKPLYDNVLGQITQADCSRIGLMISGASAEYPIWVFMGAPREDLQIEWIVTGPTQRYAKPDFKPCAILCEYCPPEWQSVRNLPLVYDDGAGFRLYLASPK